MPLAQVTQLLNHKVVSQLHVCSFKHDLSSPLLTTWDHPVKHLSSGWPWLNAGSNALQSEWSGELGLRDPQELCVCMCLCARVCVHKKEQQLSKCIWAFMGLNSLPIAFSPYAQAWRKSPFEGRWVRPGPSFGHPAGLGLQGFFGPVGPAWGEWAALPAPCPSVVALQRVRASPL